MLGQAGRLSSASGLDRNKLHSQSEIDCHHLQGYVVMQLDKPVIPNSASDVNERWISKALSYRHPGTVVQTIEEADARHGTTTNIRFKLRYRDGANPSRLPSVMWLKAGMEEHSEQFAEQVGLYEREARFYTHLQRHIARWTPRCLYSDYSAAGKSGVTLLEDLTMKGAELYYATKQISLDDVAAGIKALAEVHRCFYGGTLIDKYSWVPAPLETNVYWDNNIGASFLQKWLNEPRSVTFPSSIHDANRISVNLKKMATMLRADRSTLVHGDAHIGNSYRVAGQDGGFYDWQCIGRASPIFDISYYIVSALDSDVRRQEERRLLALYLSILNAGPPRMSLEDAWTSYQRYVLYGLWAWLTNPAHIHPEPVNIIVSNRFASAVDDLGTFASIEAW
jgi:Ecdysteroid kinase-like family